MKRNRLLTALMVLVTSLTLIFIPFGGSSDIVYATSPNTAHVTVDGQLVFFEDQLPIIVPPGRVMVPVRGVFEMMGFDVTWDPVARMARLYRHDVTIVIPADLNSFIINYSAIVTPSAPQQMINNRLMLPLRYVAEAAFGTAEWDPVNRVARITTYSGYTPGGPTPTPAPTPPGIIPTPTPAPPGATPTPTPAPLPSPRPLFTVRPWEDTTRHNITRSNAPVQGVQRTGILTRATGSGEQRNSASWIDINMANQGLQRLTGYVGRTGAASPVVGTARVATIYGDGQVLQRFTIDGNTQVTSFNIDISGVTTLRIHYEAIGPVEDNGVSLAMFNLQVQ